MRTFGQSASVAAACLGVAILASQKAGAVELVTFTRAVETNTIVVSTAERRLYLIVRPGMALRYVVGVGRAGRQWSGASNIEAKFIRPNWSPPPAIKRDKPGLPQFIPGGSPRNPMGAAALTLTGGAYAIHGTNAPESIGGWVSYGCIRMSNDDIIDLYDRIDVGAAVIVLR